MNELSNPPVISSADVLSSDHQDQGLTRHDCDFSWSEVIVFSHLLQQGQLTVTTIRDQFYEEPHRLRLSCSRCSIGKMNLSSPRVYLSEKAALYLLTEHICCQSEP